MPAPVTAEDFDRLARKARQAREDAAEAGRALARTRNTDSFHALTNARQQWEAACRLMADAEYEVRHAAR